MMPHDLILFTFCLPRICDVIVLEIIALFIEGVGNKSRILEATGCTDVCGNITKKCKKTKKELLDYIITGIGWCLDGLDFY